MDDLSICRNMKTLQAKLTPLVPQLQLISTTPADLIKNLLLAAGYSQQQVSDLMTKIYVSSSCTNIAGINQSNLIDTTTCAAVLGCSKRVDPEYVAALQNKIGYAAANNQMNVLKQLCTFNNIIQTNDATIKQSCVQSQTVKGLNDLPFSGSIQAIINTLTDAKPLDCSKFSNATRTNISKAYSSCKNTAFLNQSNIVLCAPGPSNQSNVANILQSCVEDMSTENTVADTAGSTSVTNNTSTSTTNNILTKPSGSNNTVVIITISILLIITLAGIIIYKKRST